MRRDRGQMVHGGCHRSLFVVVVVVRRSPKTEGSSPEHAHVGNSGLRLNLPSRPGHNTRRDFLHLAVATPPAIMLCSASFRKPVERFTDCGWTSGQPYVSWSILRGRLAFGANVSWGINECPQ
jgi:hypothetical protein